MNTFGRSRYFNAPSKAKKFINNKLVVVEGEEDIMVIHLASFWYMEEEGELKEIPIQSFEIVNVEMVGHVGELKTAEFLMASLRDALTIIVDTL